MIEAAEGAGLDRGFAIYIHWPLCARKCPYCDFNVYAAKDRDHAPLLEAIAADLSAWRARSGPREVTSVFFGGGTPSLLTAEEIGGLLEHIASLWGIGAGVEISLEANPEDRDRLPEIASAGVDRISLGVQSLVEADLRFLGRLHTPEDAIAAFDLARAHFRSLSLDFIYGLPDQREDVWRTQLERALSIGADHLSLYELSVEPGAAFAYAVRRGEWAPMDDDAAADLMELTYLMTEQAGMPAYEISNHARSEDHRSRHNTVYWRSGDWVGVGPGAHGRLTTEAGRVAMECERQPGAYVERVAGEGCGSSSTETLSRLDQARERVAMGLRLREGIAMDELSDLALQLEADQLAELAGQGLLRLDDNRVALTQRGWLAADRISALISP